MGYYLRKEVTLKSLLKQIIEITQDDDIGRYFDLIMRHFGDIYELAGISFISEDEGEGMEMGVAVKRHWSPEEVEAMLERDGLGVGVLGPILGANPPEDVTDLRMFVIPHSDYKKIREYLERMTSVYT